MLWKLSKNFVAIWTAPRAPSPSLGPARSDTRLTLPHNTRTKIARLPKLTIVKEIMISTRSSGGEMLFCRFEDGLGSLFKDTNASNMKRRTDSCPLSLAQKLSSPLVHFMSNLCSLERCRNIQPHFWHIILVNFRAFIWAFVSIMSHIKDRTLPSGMCQVNPYDQMKLGRAPHHQHRQHCVRL